MKNIEILHEDGLSIIVNKPAGLSVQGGKNIKTSLDMLLDRYLEDFNTKAYLVHRIDKDTSGIIMAAKNSKAAARFSQIFGAQKKALKIYTAVCAGIPAKKTGCITDELLIKGSLKKSQTSYKLIKSGKIDESNLDESGLEYSVLELELETGRMHQIRRHLAMHGNPILGDDKYGDFALNKKLQKTAGLKRLLLHASRLVIKECDIDLTAPLPEYFNRYI